jgi:hypothetical protein
MNLDNLKSVWTNETEQGEAKSQQTQTIYKMCEPTKPNNAKPKLMNPNKNVWTTKPNNAKPNTNEHRQFGLYRMCEPT